MLSVQESKIKDDAAETRAELQAELTKLQRQYRLLVDDRKSYRNETEHMLKRQHQEITSLMREEGDLMKDMNLVTQRSNHVADTKILDELRYLLKTEDVIMRTIEGDNLQLHSFQEEMRKEETKIEKLSKKVGGPGNDQERHKATQKRIRMLENRLNQATVRYNKTLARNNSHRQNIEYIFVQRRRFSDLHSKLRKLYERDVKEKNRLIDCSKALFTSREEADHRMKYLKEKGARDLASFNAELKELVRIIDHDKRLRDFMTTKEQDLNEFYEQVIQGRRDRKAASNAKVLQNEVAFYDEIFQRLVDVSGDKDVDSMVTRFIATEDKNFAMFNFVNQQEMSKKQLEVDIEYIKAEMVDMGNLRSSMSSERKRIMAELEDKYSKVTQSRKANNREDKIARKIFEEAKMRIGNLFNGIACDISGIALMLGNTTITEENMAQFLGVIERKANEMLQVKLMMAIRENNEHEISLIQAAWTGHHSKGNKSSNAQQEEGAEGLESMANYSRGSQRPLGRQGTMKPQPEDEATTI